MTIEIKATRATPGSTANLLRGRRGRDRMVVRYTTTFAISAYHH